MLKSRLLKPLCLLKIFTAVLLFVFVLFSFSLAKTPPESPMLVKDKLLRQILDVFLYTSDIENAFRTAKKGTELFPNSVYWRRWLIKTSLWTQRPKEAYRNLLYLYRRGFDHGVTKQLYNLSLALRKYETALKILENKIKKGELGRLKGIEYLYEAVGEPERGIKFLTEIYQKYRNPEVLKYIARLQYNISPLKSLSTYEKIYREGKLKGEDLLRYVNLLFVKGEIEKAYEVLKSSNSENPDYLEDLSDLAWFLNDYDTALKASLKLIDLGKGREEDYVRVILVLLKRDPSRAKEISMAAFKKFKKPYLFSYVIDAYKKAKDYKGLYHAISSLSREEQRILEEEESFWYAEIETLTKLGELKLAKRTAQEMLKKIPRSSNALITYLWLLIDMKDYKEIKDFLLVWEDRLRKERKALIALSSANALLSRFHKSVIYMKEYLKEEKNPYIIYEISELFDDAGRQKDAEFYRYKAWIKLQRIRKSNPEALKNKTFLEYYIKAGFHFLAPVEIEDMFKKAEKYLNKEKLRDLRLSYELYKGNYYKSEFLIKRKGWRAEDWMALSIALNQYDKDLMRDVLKRSAIALPIRDRVEAFQRIGDINKAQEYAFYGLSENRRDYLLYKQFRDLLVENASNLRAWTGYERRSSVDMFTASLNVRYHLTNKYFMELLHNNIYVSSYSSDSYKDLPSLNWKTMLYLGRRLERGEVKIGVGRSKGVNSNTSLDIAGSFLLSKNINLEFGAGKNMPADETIYLLLGGVKDRAFSALSRAITSRTYLYDRIEYANFFSQDRKKVGYGIQNFMELSRKLRVGYPDYTIRTFLSSGIYKEKGGNKGTLDRIAPFAETKFLPSSFNELGVGFSFGQENRDLFTGLWRPFLDLSLSYNTSYGGGFSISAGVGGEILQQDNLSLECGYNKGFRGTDEDVLRLMIRYYFFF